MRNSVKKHVDGVTKANADGLFKNGKLVLAISLTPGEINEFNDESFLMTPIPKPKPVKKSFDMDSATKKELEDFGRKEGIELDRRKTKSTLVGQLKKFLNL